MRLDPFVAATERLLAAGDNPAFNPDPAERRRLTTAADHRAYSVLGRRRIEVATREQEVVVPGYPSARLRVYWPTESPAEPGADLPVLVHFFGGAFTIAGIDWPGWDHQFRTRAHEAGVIVVAGEYSHAPEVRFPAQPEQCYAIFDWVVRHARELGADPARVAIGGASSGANLAAAATLINAERADHPVRLQLLEAPVVDLTGGHLDPRAVSRFLPRIALRPVFEPVVKEYLGPDRRLRRHRYASPLRAPTHRGLPPAVILTAELDPLRGDGAAYTRALWRAGVPATCVQYQGQTHTSGGLTGHVPAADHLHRDVVTTLRTLHDDPPEYATPAAPDTVGPRQLLADLLPWLRRR
ncbi:alpha/beta hydrolase [Naumannella huperziae]